MTRERPGAHLLMALKVPEACLRPQKKGVEQSNLSGLPYLISLVKEEGRV